MADEVGFRITNAAKLEHCGDDGLVELLAISLLHGVGANWHLD